MARRIGQSRPRTPGRHTPQGQTATIPDAPQEAPVIPLRSNETLDMLWNNALSHHAAAAQADAVAKQHASTSTTSAADAAAKHQEALRLRAQADEAFAEAERLGQTAKAEQDLAERAAAEQKRNQAILDDLVDTVDKLSNDNNRPHPRERRPLPAPEQNGQGPHISDSDPLGNGLRHGPVSNTTAPFPAVNPQSADSVQATPAFRDGAK